jgi:large subunit ribosomal protein L25
LRKEVEMEVRIKAQIREEIGKSAVKKLRREGFLPAVAYGAGEKTLSLKINKHDFLKFLRSIKGESVLIKLAINRRVKTAILKDIERDPVTGEVLHVDFQLLHKGERVSVTVPVVLVGTPEGVKMGGVMEQILREIEIRAIPSKIPAHIEVDVSGLKIGDSIHVRDLKLEDVEILEDEESTIVTVIAPKRVTVEEEEVVAEEAEVTEEEAPTEEETKEES